MNKLRHSEVRKLACMQKSQYTSRGSLTPEHFLPLCLNLGLYHSSHHMPAISQDFRLQVVVQLLGHEIS